ncbi:hypothetical protein ACFE04_008344 [Oxalis oulophora]
MAKWPLAPILIRTMGLGRPWVEMNFELSFDPPTLFQSGDIGENRSGGLYDNTNPIVFLKIGARGHLAILTRRYPFSCMADNWIELPSLSQWPQPLGLKSIDQLSEIYFLQRVWKTVEVTYLQSVLNVEDETSGFHPCKAILENYVEKNLTIGKSTKPVCNMQNHWDQDFGRVWGVMKKWTKKELRQRGEKDVAIIVSQLLCNSIEAGNEWEISVEWIGCLEKRQTKVGKFVDADTKDITNRYEEITAEDNQQYSLEYKTHLQIGVQVDIKQRDRNTQSDDDQCMEIESTNLAEAAWYSGKVLGLATKDGTGFED